MTAGRKLNFFAYGTGLDEPGNVRQERARETRRPSETVGDIGIDVGTPISSEGVRRAAPGGMVRRLARPRAHPARLRDLGFPARTGGAGGGRRG